MPFLGKKNRPDWCPILCQLPEGHGDLIDRDELLKESYPDDEYDAYVVYADDICKARAVVLAEAESQSPKQADPLPICRVEQESSRTN